MNDKISFEKLFGTLSFPFTTMLLGNILFPTLLLCYQNCAALTQNKNRRELCEGLVLTVTLSGYAHPVPHQGQSLLGPKSLRGGCSSDLAGPTHSCGVSPRFLVVS